MKKRLVALALALMMALTMVACGEKEEPAPEKPGAPATEKTEETKEGFVIGYSNMVMGSNVWMQQMEAEAEHRLQQYKDEGVISEYYMTNADGDLMKQQQDIRDLITKGCDAIMYCPISTDGLNGVLQEAHDAGITLIAFGQNSTSPHNIAYIGTNDAALGEQMGTFLGNAIPQGGKVLEIAGIPGAETAEIRKAAAEEAFFAANPTAEILTVEYCNWDYAETKVAMESMIVTHPEFDGILTLCGASAMACIDVLQEHNMDVVPMPGESTNGFLKQWKALNESTPGGYPSCAVISPPRQSVTALDILIKYMQTGELPEMENGTIWDVVDAITLDTLDSVVREDIIDGYYIGGDMLDEETKLELFGVK